MSDTFLDKIVIFSTAWGPSYGGINAFNFDLCKSLSQLLKDQIEIILVVNELKESDRLECTNAGIKLIQIGSLNEHNPEYLKMLSNFLEKQIVIDKGKVLWWIGHDNITGDLAIQSKKLYFESKCAIFHHMDYEAYKSLQEEDPDLLWQKIENQTKVLCSADLILSVGPKLTTSAKDKVKEFPNIIVKEIIPGLPEISSLPLPLKFSVITFGRMEKRNDIIKQLNLVVSAYSEAKSNDPDPLGSDSILSIIGLSKDEFNDEKLQVFKTAEERAHKVINILGRPYQSDRKQLFDYLKKQSVCLMLSIHEGFGLVGWEAIGAEIPLIVSSNSGLYEAVDNLLGGMGTGCLTVVDVKGSINEPHFQESDVKLVAIKLIDIKMKIEKAKKNAKMLKELLQKICTWENTAISVAKALNLNLTSEIINKSLDRWSPDMLINGLTHSTDLVENVARRKQQFQLIWDRMKPPSGFSKLLILFGGISSTLCDENASENYCNWLKSNPESKLFLCYESGPGALARAEKLDSQRLDTSGGLPNNAISRMIEKEKRVLNLKTLIEQHCKAEKNDYLSRFFLIPLVEPLTTYIMITDDDIYMTPLLETRSSETLSFALAKKPIQFRLDIFNFIIYHLEMIEEINGTYELIPLLRKKILEEMNDN